MQSNKLLISGILLVGIVYLTSFFLYVTAPRPAHAEGGISASATRMADALERIAKVLEAGKCR